MKLAEVRKLVKLVETSDIHELEFEQDGSRIRVVKGGAAVAAIPAPTVVAAPATAQVAPAPAAPDAGPAPDIQETAASNLHEIKSPMVGTFYRAPAPDADPYVTEGDVVRPGQTLCIVEAMKLMNEIECDVAGRIVEISINNTDPVEFGQVMFRIDPKG